MADRFDGTDFLGIDADAVGDGQSGTSQPLDTYLENVVDNNTIHDWERGWSVGYSFYDDGEVKRPIASFAEACFFRFDLFADPAPDQLIVSLLVDVLNDLDSDQEVRFILKVGPYTDPYETRSQVVRAVDVSGSEPTVAQIQMTGISSLTGEGAAFLPVWVCLENVRGRNFLPESDQASVASQNEDLLRLSSDIGLSETEVLELTRFISQTGGYVGSTFFAMADVLDAENDGNDTYAGIRLPPGTTPPDTELEGAKSLAIDYAELYGLTIDVEYDTDEYGQYGDKRASSMRAQSTVRGRDTVQHPQRLNATQVRPRLLHAGVPNREGEQFPSRVTRWHHTNAYEAETVTTMFTLPVELVEPTGQLHFRHNLLPTAQFETDSQESRFPYANRDLTEVLTNYYRACDWRFIYYLQTLDPVDDTWSTVATGRVDRGVDSGDPLRHYMAQLVSTSPWVMQTGLMQNNNNNFSRTYAEGLMYQQDAQILSQNFLSGTIDLPDTPFYDPTSGRQPCRLIAQAQWTDYDDLNTPQATLDLDPPDSDSQDDLETVRLATPGFSLYQICEV